MSIHIITHLDKDKSSILNFLENVKSKLICEYDSETTLINEQEVLNFQTETTSNSGNLLKILQIVFSYREKIIKDQKAFTSLMTIFSSQISETENATEKTELLNEYFSFYKSLSPQQFSLKARMLSCLFNAFPITDPYQYEIFKEIVIFTDQNKKISTILTSIEKIDKYLENWGYNTNIDKTREIYRLILIALMNNNKEKVGIELFIKYLRSYENSSDEIIKNATDSSFIRELIKKFLENETLHDDLFEEILSLKRVFFIDNKLLFEVIELLVIGDLLGFKKWLEKHRDYLEKDLAANIEKIEEKIRIKCLATFDEKAKFVSFKEIAEKLQVPEDDVENWVIMGIQSKIISGKIDEFNKIIEIHDNSSKYLEKRDLELLDGKLTQFIGILEGYLEKNKSRKEK